MVTKTLTRNGERVRFRRGGIVGARQEVPEIANALYRILHKITDYDEVDRITRELRDGDHVLEVQFPNHLDDAQKFLKAQQLEVVRIKEALAERHTNQPLSDLEYLVWLHESVCDFVEVMRLHLVPRSGVFANLFVNCFLVDIWHLIRRDAKEVIKQGEICGL